LTHSAIGLARQRLHGSSQFTSEIPFLTCGFANRPIISRDDALDQDQGRLVPRRERAMQWRDEAMGGDRATPKELSWFGKMTITYGLGLGEGRRAHS
jgi:hypothetical protein